jgi:hypothetical protein
MVETKDWDRLALCLLIGLVETLSELPPDSIDTLIELLEYGEGPEEGDA